MSKYFYDTEFLEGTQKRRIGGLELPKFFDTKNTIDLISIGIVSEDNREYYAVSKDFNLKEAWNRYDLETEQVYVDMRNIFPNGRKKKVYWIRGNVLKPIFNEWMREHNGNIVRLGLPIPLESNKFTYKNFKKWLQIKGKSNKEISKDIIDFVNPDLMWPVSSYNNSELKSGGRLDEHFNKHNVTSDGSYYYAQPEFYGYYSSYDHVVICCLFGKMIDLPKGFPMHTIDLKQTFDEKQQKMYSIASEQAGVNLDGFGEYGVLMVDRTEYDLKKSLAYPVNKEEHSAISDARWTKELYEFLIKI